MSMRFQSFELPLHPKAVALLEEHFLADPRDLLVAFKRAQLDFKAYVEQINWRLGYEDMRFLEGCPGFEERLALLPDIEMVDQLYKMAEKVPYAIEVDISAGLEEMVKQGIGNPNEDVTRPLIQKGYAVEWLYARFLDHWLDRVSSADLSGYFNSADPVGMDKQGMPGLRWAVARQVQKRPELKEWLRLTIAHLDALNERKDRGYAYFLNWARGTQACLSGDWQLEGEGLKAESYPTKRNPDCVAYLLNQHTPLPETEAVLKALIQHQQEQFASSLHDQIAAIQQLRTSDPHINNEITQDILQAIGALRPNIISTGIKQKLVSEQMFYMDFSDIYNLFKSTHLNRLPFGQSKASIRETLVHLCQEWVDSESLDRIQFVLHPHFTDEVGDLKQSAQLTNGVLFLPMSEKERDMKLERLLQHMAEILSANNCANLLTALWCKWDFSGLALEMNVGDDAPEFYRAFLEDWHSTRLVIEKRVTDESDRLRILSVFDRLCHPLIDKLHQMPEFHEYINNDGLDEVSLEAREWAARVMIEAVQQNNLGVIEPDVVAVSVKKPQPMRI